ncbi:hypothetical protein C8J57DRAFT_1222600 [Mycena rebaudengoi]|nr:hypothetical protein C8J57DRAFT_1222600 [Mycena rebaudengoi]
MSLGTNFLPARTPGQLLNPNSEKLKRNAQRAKAKHKSPPLIPRPQGQIGCGKLNLREAMGLLDDKNRYNRLYVHISLDVQRTISKQGHNKVNVALNLLAERAPYFRRFQGYWPAKAMMSGYLINLQARRKKDAKAEEKASGKKRGLMQEEGAWKKKRKANDENEEEDGEKKRKREGRRRRRRMEALNQEPTKIFEILSDAEDDEDEEDDPPPPRKTSKKLRVESDDEASSDEVPEPIRNRKRKPGDAPAGAPAAKKPKTLVQMTPMKTKPKTPSKTAVPNSAKSKIAARKPTPAPPRRKTPATTSASLSWSDLPDMCPAVYCKHKLPTKPNKCILSLFTKRDNLLSTGRFIGWLDLQLCGAITDEKERELCAELGKERSWPLEIDFASVHARILDLDEPLMMLLADPNVLRESEAWDRFLANIDYKIFKFCASESKQVFPDVVAGAHCGILRSP